jgi:hypothetical protein
MLSKNVHLRLLSKALIISLLLNLGMILAGLTAGVKGESNFLTELSDIIAAPPGLIISRCCAPREHSAHAFFAAILVSTAISILFYACSSVQAGLLSPRYHESQIACEVFSWPIPRIPTKPA